MSMRVILANRDQLRRTTPEQLPSYCEAVLGQFEQIAAAANAWAEQDHNSDGSHALVRIGETAGVPKATVGALTVYWDGTNLKWMKPDGTTGNLV